MSLEPKLTNLQKAVGIWRFVLNGDLTASIIKENHDKITQIINVNFNADVYPTLFSNIGDGEQYLALFKENGKATWGKLLKSWAKQSNEEKTDKLIKLLQNAFNQEACDPLIRLMVAFIWKQRDLKKVIHVLDGLCAGENDIPPKNGTVMWQLGKHLKDPLNEPLFDQHTSRARWLLDKMQENCQITDLVRNVPREAILKNADNCISYCKWWRDNIKKKLPAENNGAQDRISAVLWSDRLMYSLGKATKEVLC